MRINHQLYSGLCYLTMFLTVAAGIPAQAAMVQTSVSGDITSAASNPFGLNNGDTFSAVAIYDDSLITGSGTETIAYTNPSAMFSLSLTFGSASFTEADDDFFPTGFPVLQFDNGALRGINFEKAGFSNNGFNGLTLGFFTGGSSFHNGVFLEDQGGTTILEGNIDHTTSVTGPVATSNPALTVNGPLNFGNVLVGGPSPSLNATATNAGDAGSTLNGTINAVTGSSDFSSTNSAFSLSQGASDSSAIAYTPGQRGTDNGNVSVTSDGGNANIAVTGKGVAPQLGLNTSNADAGNVRIGTSGTASVGIQNVGDGGLVGVNLTGTLGAGIGKFTGGSFNINLADSANQTFNYTYTPTTRATDNSAVSLSLSNGSVDGTNQAVNQNVGLSGTGVGPQFESFVAPGGTLDFGNVNLGNMGLLTLTIDNNSPDGDLGNLTDLSILNISIGGADAGDFDIVGFSPSILATGESIDVSIQFDPATLGLKVGSLLVETDQSAAFGGDGLNFVYSLVGTATAIIPEPTSIMLSAMGIALLAKRRRNCRQNIAQEN